MREKGRLLKVFAICCFAFLFMFFISLVCLHAQDQKKDTIEDKKQQTEQNQDKTSSAEVKKETEEDIPSPDSDEDWVEPDDEQIYKFEINQSTPKEGLMGGFLIYYGHLIVPPYKIEIRDPKDWSVYINNIPFDTPPKVFTDKFSKRYKEKRMKILEPYIKIYKENEDQYKSREEEWEKLRKELRKGMWQILKKYGSYEENKEKVDAEIRQYFASHPMVIEYRYSDFYNWGIKPRIKGMEKSFRLVSGSGLPPISKEEASKEHAEHLETRKNAYQSDILQNNIFFSNGGGSGSFLELNRIKEICVAKESSWPLKTKLVRIYKILKTETLSTAKLFYYNFDCIKFVQKAEINEK